MWALFLVFSDSESRSHRRILCSWGLGQPPQQAFSHSGYRDALLATFTIGELKEYLQNQRVRSCHNLPYEKVGKSEPVCIADEVPFDIPESWEWVRLGRIVYNRGQMKPNDDFCYIDIGSIDNKNQKLSDEENILAADRAPSRARKIVSAGDILYSTVRPYLHNMCIIDRSFSHQPIASTGFAALSCHTGYYNEFLFYYLMSPDFDAYANDIDNAKGVAYPAINDKKLYQALIPVPPELEQKRIVEKFKEVLPYIDAYGTAYSEIDALNAAFPDCLKKSILQEAVQGKLVPQDPADEPASVLLDRIRAEKERLIKEGKIKRDKHESVIFRRDNSHYEKLDGIERCIDDEILFEIPDSWAWTSVGEVCTNIQYGSSKKSSPSGKIAVLRMGNLQNGRIMLDKLVYTSDSKEIEKYPLDCNDLLFNRTNSKDLVGKVAIYKGELPAIYAGYLVRLHPLLIDSDYLNYVMQSQYYWIYCQNVRSDAIGQSNINAEKLKRFLFPLPPLLEQKRIAYEISQLMAKIEHL